MLGISFATISEVERPLCIGCGVFKPSENGSGICLPCQALETPVNGGNPLYENARRKDAAKVLLSTILTTGIGAECPRETRLIDKVGLPPYRWKNGLNWAPCKTNEICGDCSHVDSKVMPHHCIPAYSIVTATKREAINIAGGVCINLRSRCPLANNFREISQLINGEP